MAESSTLTDGAVNSAPNDKVVTEDDTNEGATKTDERSPLIKGTSSPSGMPAWLYHDVSVRWRVDITWQHILIGPIVWMYFFGMISGFFVLMIYTKQCWKDIEYENANLSTYTTVSPCDNVSSRVSDADTKATSKSSEWIMYYSLIAGVPAVISNFIVGAYLDTFGRRRILTVSIVGTALRLVIQGIVIFCRADIGFFLIACFVEGCTGQHATCFAGALAYMADMTLPGKSRAIGLAVIEGCVQTAIALASFTTGYMVESWGFKTAMIVDVFFLSLALIAAVFLLPETRQNSENPDDKTFVKQLKLVCQFFTKNDETNSRWKYQVTIAALALTNMSVLSRFPTETLYQLTQPFCWSPAKSGVYFAIRTVCMTIIGES